MSGRVGSSTGSGSAGLRHRAVPTATVATASGILHPSLAEVRRVGLVVRAAASAPRGACLSQPLRGLRGLVMAERAAGGGEGNELLVVGVAGESWYRPADVEPAKLPPTGRMRGVGRWRLFVAWVRAR